MHNHYRGSAPSRTRTLNLLIKSVGVQVSKVKADKDLQSMESTACTNACPCNQTLDDDLLRVIESWRLLPNIIRDAILGMADAAIREADEL